MKKTIVCSLVFSFTLFGCASLNEEKVAETVKNTATSDSSEEVVRDAANRVTNELSGRAAAAIDSVIPNSTTEISVQDVSKGGDSHIEILNITGFGESIDGHTQNFVQSSAIRADSRTTINLGLGRRYLSDDETVIYGLNAFFDIDPENDHQRASIGAEIKSSALELTVNNYYGITGFKEGKNGNSERALGGYDVELGAQLPYIPAAKFYLKQFQWDLHDDVADIKGQTYSLEFAQMFNSGLSIEAGQKNFDGLRENETFVQLTYTLPYGNAPKSSSGTTLFSKNMFEQRSMKQDMLKKVRRHNQIVVQTRFSTAVGGL
tara:strand:- start:600 stop:1556 length:957 start_codon:yes stop_codon:yes gene_type:complete